MRFAELWRWDGTINRARYALVGLAAFAVKFADMFRRRRVLFGSDPLAQVEVPRGAIVTRSAPAGRRRQPPGGPWSLGL